LLLHWMTKALVAAYRERWVTWRLLLHWMTKALVAAYRESRGEACRAEKELRLMIAPRLLKNSFIMSAPKCIK